MLGRPPVILGYHGIGEVDPKGDPVRLYVSEANFRRQIASMLRRGYRFVSMTELGGLIDGHGPPPPGVAAITFDDGTEDHASVVPGLLEELGVPATIYICPELLGAEYPWSEGRRFMTREEFDRTAAHPLVEIGAHTNRHVVLDNADYETAVREMGECKQTLAGMIADEVTSFCYPRCFYTEACLRAAADTGYLTAVTCGPRGGWGRHELAREIVHTPDGPLSFALKARGVHTRVRTTPPARFVRALTRPYRHRAERGA